MITAGASFYVSVFFGWQVTYESSVQVGEFKLHVRRDVGKLKGSAVPATAPALPPVPTKPMVDSRPPAPTAAPSSSPKSNNSITAMTGSFSKTASLFGLLEAAADEGLLFVTSPKVRSLPCVDCILLRTSPSLHSYKNSDNWFDDFDRQWLNLEMVEYIGWAGRCFSERTNCQRQK